MDTKSDIMISEKLRKGEKILCQKCHKDYYVTDCTDKPTSHFFYCPKCNQSINIDDSIIVE